MMVSAASTVASPSLEISSHEMRSRRLVFVSVARTAISGNVSALPGCLQRDLRRLHRDVGGARRSRLDRLPAARGGHAAARADGHRPNTETWLRGEMVFQIVNGTIDENGPSGRGI